MVGEDRWDLSAMGRTPGDARVSLMFADTARTRGRVNYDPGRAGTLKRIAYLLINKRVPATVAMAPGNSSREEWMSAHRSSTCPLWVAPVHGVG